MRQDDHINKALKIGENNQRVIELAKNFCKHLKVEPSAWAGVGIVEQMTGLPIAGRDCKCQYARARAVSGMDFETVALDFYEKNCKDCDKRDPVSIPNLTMIIEEKEKEVAQQAQIHDQIKEARNKEYEARKNKRESFKSGNQVKNKIIELIDVVDKEFNRSESDKLIEMARLAPEKFDEDLIGLLFDLAGTQDFFKCELAFEVLTLIANEGKSYKDGELIIVERESIKNGVDVNALVKLALKALGGRNGSDDAAGVVSLWLEKEHEEDISGHAIYTLIRMAFPRDDFAIGGRITYNPVPLLKVFSFFPAKVLEVIRDLLKREDKGLRIETAGAVGYIAEKYPDQILEIVGDLLTSVSLPDDIFEGGRASGVIAKTISKIFIAHPNEVDEKIQSLLKRITDEEISGEIFSVYEDVIAEDKFKDKVKLIKARKFAAKRILSTLNEKPNKEILDSINNALGRSRYHGYDPYEGLEDLLITAAANLSEELNNPYSPLTDPSPNTIKHIEAQSRGMALTQALDKVQICLGQLGRIHIDPAGLKIIECIENFKGDNIRLKSRLIASLGHVGCSPNGISLVIPILNKAFTDKEVRIRAAAVEAYGVIAKANFEALPSSFHEYFYASLNDPYRLVHGQAVEIIRFSRIKISDKAVVRKMLIFLIVAYINENKNLDYLATLIDTLLDLFNDDDPLDEKWGKYILNIIPKISPYERCKVLLHNRWQLEKLEGYSELLASLTLEEYLYQLNIGEAVDIIRLFEPAQIQKVKSILCEGAKKLALYQYLGYPFEIIELLSIGLCWAEIIDITGFLLSKVEDTIENKPLRLRIEAYSIAAKIEDALLRKVPQKQISTEISNWQLNLEVIREDHEKNADRRNSFRGFRLPRKNP